MRIVFVAVGIVVVVAGWMLGALLTPIDHGIDRSGFQTSERDDAPVEGTLRWRQGTRPLRPNVVVILADDLGYGDLGVQGSRAIATPHMDQLAGEGLRLSQFYASAPVCSPSRAGLLTGRYPLRSGIVAALQAADDTLLRTVMYKAGIGLAKAGSVDLAGGTNAVAGLSPSEVTVAEGLRVAGYRTMAIGKWHLGDFTELPEYHPSNHGFDQFVGFNMSNDDWPVAFWRDQEEIVEDIGLDQAHYTKLFTEEASRFIEEASDEPFFLYLAHKDPHQPFFPSEPFIGKSLGGPYGDAVSEFDWSVGQVIDAIHRAGIANETLVIVTSDNGPWYEGSPGGLRGRKGQSYEGGFRVPFIAWWPGQIPAGSTNAAPAMNIDLLPTLFGLAGIDGPVDRRIDGEDQWPVWSGAQPHLPERALYFYHDYDIEAVRLGAWKLIDRNSHYVWPVPLDKTDTPGGRLAAGRDYHPPGAAESVPTMGTWPLLYNLEIDPNEAYNVAASNPETTRTLTARLEAWRREFIANPRGWR